MRGSGSQKGRRPRAGEPQADRGDARDRGGKVSSCTQRGRLGLELLLPRPLRGCRLRQRLRLRPDTPSRPFPSSPTFFTGTPRETHPSSYPKKEILEHSQFILHPLTVSTPKSSTKIWLCTTAGEGRSLQSLI